MPKLLANQLYSLFYSLLGLNVHKTSRIRYPFTIQNRKCICIGKHAFLNSRAWISVCSTSHASPQLTIEDNVYIGRDFVCSLGSSIIIREGATISDRVYVEDTSHCFVPNFSIQRSGFTTPLPTEIGSYSWIGIGVVILSGVVIGKNCIVGANSVVTRSLPDNCIAAGNPAKIIRYIS